MKRILYKIINKLGYNIQSKKTKSEELLRPLTKYSHLNNFNIIVLAKNYILNLENKYRDFKIKNHKQGFMVSFSNLNIYIESLEEFHILNEVFINDDYHYTTKKKSILIDIGCNIGITSLFFSTFSYIEKIIAFEPVRVTYEQAKLNFQLNAKMCKVDAIKNVGLGKSAREERFLFDSKVKGNTGIRGKLSPSYSKNKSAEEISVNINEASSEILEITNQNRSLKVIVKMDCEGAEYEILENLKETGVIDEIDVLLMEWHDKGTEMIEKILEESGFEYFSKRFSSISGIIYAYKSVK
jgi:FkbM family methyltransferase